MGLTSKIEADEGPRGASTTADKEKLRRLQLVEYEKDGEVHSYSYDSNGNRLSYSAPGHAALEGTYDAQDRIQSWGDWTYSYTEQGDLVQRTNGTLAITLQYDELGNLLNAELGDSSATVSVDYQVDAMGRRVSRVSSTGDEHYWVYQDNLRPVGEVANGVFTQYVYANDSIGGAPDFMVRSGVAYRLLKDHIGSVRFVVNANTGAVVQELSYDPFGRVLGDTNPGYQPFGFAGGLYDWETKLVRFGARDYDPGVGRWTAKDLIGFAGGQSNLYVYVGNDPVNLIDPRGTSTFNFGVGGSVGSSIVQLGFAAFGVAAPTNIRGGVGVFVDFSNDGVRLGLYETVDAGLGLAGPLGNIGLGLEAGLTNHFHNFVGNAESSVAEVGVSGATINDNGGALGLGLALAGGFAGKVFSETSAQGALINTCGISGFLE